MALRCHKTQIIYRYVSQYILADSHGRIYNVRDWDSFPELWPFENLGILNLSARYLENYLS